VYFDFSVPVFLLELEARLRNIIVTNTRHFHTERVPSIKDFLNQLIINSGSSLPHLPQSPHYPTKIICCFAVALNKITTVSHLLKLFGKNWVKRLQVTDTKRFITIISSEKYSALRK
jgi:hypothetical protein